MSNELIQIHGGIGMTDEFDAGLYLKRARPMEATFGNQAYHRTDTPHSAGSERADGGRANLQEFATQGARTT